MWTPQEESEFAYIKNTFRIDGIITDNIKGVWSWIDDYKSLQNLANNIENERSTSPYLRLKSTFSPNIEDYDVV